MTDLEEKKAIGNYKIKFKTIFDNKKSDYINLNIQVSEDLKNLLKEAVIDEETTIDYKNKGEDTIHRIKRYKVKKWIYNGLYTPNRDYLFCKKLIKYGEETLQLTDINQIDQLIDDIKESLRRLIELMLKYTNIDITINYNLEKPQRREVQENEQQN